jgi:hypothetical protein
MIFRSDLFFANPLETGLGFEIASEMSFSTQDGFLTRQLDFPGLSQHCL